MYLGKPSFKNNSEIKKFSDPRPQKNIPAFTTKRSMYTGKKESGHEKRLEIQTGMVKQNGKKGMLVNLNNLGI